MPQDQLRILQVTAPGPVGGLESVVTALSLGLAGRGHEVTVSAAVDPSLPHPFLDRLAEGGVRIVRAGGGYWAEAPALRTLAGQVGAHAVHSHGYRSDVLARIGLRGRRFPLVTTVHGFTGGGLKNRLYERIEIFALRGFDAVVPVSAPLAQQLRDGGIQADRLHLVPNAYAPSQPLEDRQTARRRLGLPPDGVVIGWVGRLSREKGADVALHALASLPHRDWTAVFLGDGPERSALERLGERLGLSNRIRWMGTFTGAGAVMSGFDLLLSSSRTEGTPIVLLEAAAAAVPFVATAVGGVPDLFPDRGVSSLAPPDDPAALGKRLANLLEHPEDARREALAVRDRLAAPARFEAWLDRYEAIYHSLQDAATSRRESA